MYFSIFRFVFSIHSRSSLRSSMDEVRWGCFFVSVIVWWCVFRSADQKFSLLLLPWTAIRVALPPAVASTCVSWVWWSVCPLPTAHRPLGGVKDDNKNNNPLACPHLASVLLFLSQSPWKNGSGRTQDTHICPTQTGTTKEKSKKRVQAHPHPLPPTAFLFLLLLFSFWLTDFWLLLKWAKLGDWAGNLQHYFSPLLLLFLVLVLLLHSKKPSQDTKATSDDTSRLLVGRRKKEEGRRMQG